MEALLSAEAWLRAHLALQPCSAQPAPTPWGYQAGSPPRKAERMCGHLTSYPAPPQPGCVSSASVGTSLSLSFLLSQPLRGLGQEAWKGFRPSLSPRGQGQTPGQGLPLQHPHPGGGALPPRRPAPRSGVGAWALGAGSAGVKVGEQRCPRGEGQPPCPRPAPSWDSGPPALSLGQAPAGGGRSPLLWAALRKRVHL